MNILHVASFQGNVGDNANHNGLRNILTEILGTSPTYTQLEMRRFYRNYDGPDGLKFDNAFAELANKFDLVIFGGGNFFEIWLEDSGTGCTIDIGSEVLQKTRTKLLFFGLGFDKYKGCSAATEQKFLSFMKNLNAQGNALVTVRNDGSMRQFRETYPEEDWDLITEVPDGGFFVEPETANVSFLPVGRFNLLLNVALDMPNVRFGDDSTNKVDELVVCMAEYIKTMCLEHKDLHVTIMPHIYSDLEIASRILARLPDFIRRNCVGVGPCVSGMGAEHLIFDAYKNANLIVSMRFHPSVCGIGMGVPTIGISTYKKIRDLYAKLGLESDVVDFPGGSFLPEILETSRKMITDSEVASAKRTSIALQLKQQLVSVLAAFLLTQG